MPCKISFFFEGEEESGSPSLVPFMETHKEALKADVVLICDSGLFDDRVPAIVTMLRGMVSEEVVIARCQPRFAFRSLWRDGAQSTACAQ